MSLPPGMTVLEDMTLEAVWQSYRQSLIPQDVDPFIVERMKSAWVCGAYAMVALEHRLRTESPERRTALLDRWLAELLAAAQLLDGKGTTDG
jgi:hypothetical protein